VSFVEYEAFIIPHPMFGTSLAIVSLIDIRILGIKLTY